MSELLLEEENERLRERLGALVSSCGIKFGSHRAHRVSYFLADKTIPSKYVLDHMCGVRHCVNPAHLRAVTVKQNSTENNSGPAALNKVKVCCKVGHTFDEKNTGSKKLKNGTLARVCRLCNTLRMREARK